MADLNDRLRLDQTWVALGADHVALAREANGRPEPSIRSFARSRIRSIREVPGLSCTVLMVLAGRDEPALAVLRYTHRQRRAMENLKFVLEEQINGHSVASADPDQAYSAAVARPVKDAQASVAGKSMMVLWRLVAYLKPYRRQVSIGFVTASILSLISLVPRRLTGFFIYRVVGGFERGPTVADGLTRGQALSLAGFVIAGIAAVLILREVSAWLRMRTMSVLG